MIFNMKKLLKNERGVALMLVLGSLLILTTMVVEFAYNAHVGYDLAASERDRLKSYYLARSGYNMARLELKFEKDIRARYASLLKDMKGSGVTADPLCKQIPLSTGLLKGLAQGQIPGLSGGTATAGTDTAGEEGAEKKPAEDNKGEKETKTGAEAPKGEAVEGAEEFLNFDGDFAVECDTEERKINLNVFRADPLAPAAPTPGGPTGAAAAPPAPGEAPLSPYDLQKQLLFSLMSQKDFQPIFQDKPDEIHKVVNAIADWADRDDRVNEAPGMAGGAEDADYTGAYKVKNGRYATVEELLLVNGVGDDLFKLLEPQVTVYGDTKLNICQASDPMIKAFINRYIAATPGMGPISETDDEKWNTVVETVHFACSEPSPQPASVAAAIGPTIGAIDTKTLAAQITTANRFYRIEATGIVGESQSRIAAVIDAGSSNPNLWKTLYFRVE
jgi:general secretion pathway protein K